MNTLLRAKIIHHLKTSLLIAGCFVFVFSTHMESLVYAEGSRNFNPDAPHLTPFYNPSAGLGGLCSSFSDIGIEGRNNGEKIWGYLGSRGLTPEQSAGIMGNLFQESGYIPTIQERVAGRGDRENAWAAEVGGWGLAQWTGGRRIAIRDAVIETLGEEYYTMDELPEEMNDDLLLFQLEFMYEEMQVRRAYAKDASLRNRVRGLTEWEAIQQMSTVEDALVLFHDSFERSADTPSEVIRVRGGFAEQALNDFGGITSFGGQFCATFSSGDLQDLVLEYAWPEYFPPPHIEMMPAYAAAVRRAQSEGRYVGGGVRPGIDCGGFTTTLLVDSGFEPNYNHSGLLREGAGNTVTQRAWVEANWQEVGRGSEINVAELQPGDIAFSPGHTFVFVGEIEGFDSNIASASYSERNRWRTPMAGRESLVAGNVTWFRKVE